jgi:hypothetical protein
MRRMSGGRGRRFRGRVLLVISWLFATLWLFPRS